MARHISEIERIVADAGLLVVGIKDGGKAKKNEIFASLVVLSDASADLLSAYGDLQDGYKQAVSDTAEISMRAADADAKVRQLAGIVDSQKAMIDAVSDR